MIRARRCPTGNKITRKVVIWSVDPVERMEKRKEWLKQWIDDCKDMKAINYIYGMAIRLPEKEKTPSDRA